MSFSNCHVSKEKIAKLKEQQWGLSLISSDAPDPKNWNSIEQYTLLTASCFVTFRTDIFAFSWSWRIAGVKEVGTQQDSNGGAKVNRGLIDEWQGSETKKGVVLCHRHTIIFKGFWVAVTLRSCYFLSQPWWKFGWGYYTKLAPARFILGTKMALWFSQQLKSCICFWAQEMGGGRSGGFFSEVLGEMCDELFHMGSNGKSWMLSSGRKFNDCRIQAVSQ